MQRKDNGDLSYHAQHKSTAAILEEGSGSVVLFLSSPVGLGKSE